MYRFGTRRLVPRGRVVQRRVRPCASGGLPNRDLDQVLARNGLGRRHVDPPVPVVSLIVDRHTDTVSHVESATKAMFWLGERKRLLLQSEAEDNADERPTAGPAEHTFTRFRM